MASSYEEDDLDMLAVMATLERTTGGGGATQQGEAQSVQDSSAMSWGHDVADFRVSNAAAASTQQPVVTTAAAALEQLLSSGGALSAAALQRSNAAAKSRPKLSAGAAAIMTTALSRHPAFSLHCSRTEVVSQWHQAVKASEAYHVEDIHDDVDVDNTDGADEEKKKINTPSVENGAADDHALSVAGNQAVTSGFAYVQHVADELECERLQAVFQGVTAVDCIRATEGWVGRRYGVDAAKSVAYPGDAAAVPQRIYFHCLFGPLLSPHFVDWVTPASSNGSTSSSASRGGSLCELHVPLVSTTLARAVERISRNTYDTAAWLTVIQEMIDMPLSECRSAWLHAAYLFPTSNPLIVEYVKKELDALASLCASSSSSSTEVSFREGDDEEEAKHIFRARLRLLNLFYRHLPRCASWQLYDLFLTFAGQHTTLDDNGIDRIFRTALEQHVGLCVDSTPLWVRYLEWRAAKIRSIPEKQKFVRTMFHRILRTPLDGLAEVRERYDLFESADIGSSSRGGAGGKVRLEDELERSITRAKSFAADRVQALRQVLHQEFPRCVSQGDPRKEQPEGTQPVYLPRPFRSSSSMMEESSLQRLYGVSKFGVNEKDTCLEEDECFAEQQLWVTWESILRGELETNHSAAQSEDGHFRRVVFALRMRAMYFPHELLCWTDLCEAMCHGLPKRIRTDFGPTGDVGSANVTFLGPKHKEFAVAVLEEVLGFLPFHMHVTVTLAHMYRQSLGLPDQGGRLLQQALDARKQRLVREHRELDRIIQLGSSSTSSAQQRGGGLDDAKVGGGGSYLTVASAQASRFTQSQTVISELLVDLVVLGGNWLTYARIAYPREGPTQCRLVAKYLMHDFELLSLIMSSVRRLAKAASVLCCLDLLDTRSLLDRFNAFCSHWIDVELRQLHCTDVALLVLHGWAHQLKTMIASTRSQHWSLSDCGVDQRFFARARDIGLACVVYESTATASSTTTTQQQQPPHVREVFDIVQSVVDVFPRMDSVVVVATTSSSTIRAAANATAVPERRWVARMCQELDPIGAMIRTHYPTLAVYHTAALDGVDLPKSLAVVRSPLPSLSSTHEADAAAAEQPEDAAWEAMRAAHTKRWMSGVEGINSGMRSATQFLWSGTPLASTLPNEFCGFVAATAAGFCPPTQQPQDEMEMVLGQSIRQGGEDDANASWRKTSSSSSWSNQDDLEPVHPNAMVWQDYVPPPPQRVVRPRHSQGGRGGRGVGGATSRGGAAAALGGIEGNSEAQEEDDDADTALLSSLGEQASGRFDAGAGSQLLSVGGALMSLSSIMQKRVRQTLGHRVAVQLPDPFSGITSVAEGLAFSLDHVDASTRLARLKMRELDGERDAKIARTEGNSNNDISNPQGQMRRPPRPETPQSIVASLWTRKRLVTTPACGFQDEEVRCHRDNADVYSPTKMSTASSSSSLAPLEALLSRALPSRYSMGPVFDEQRISVSWLMATLKQCDALVIS